MQLTDQVAAQIRHKPGVEYSVLVPNMRGFQDALKAKARYITIFGSATEAFSRANINCTIEESFAALSRLPQRQRSTASGCGGRSRV